MRIQSIDSCVARCEARGVERVVSLFMLQHETLEPGDFVVVHLSHATQKVTPGEARAAWDIYDLMLATEDCQSG